MHVKNVPRENDYKGVWKRVNMCESVGRSG